MTRVSFPHEHINKMIYIHIIMLHTRFFFLSHSLFCILFYWIHSKKFNQFLFFCQSWLWVKYDETHFAHSTSNSGSTTPKPSANNSIYPICIVSPVAVQYTYRHATLYSSEHRFVSFPLSSLNHTWLLIKWFHFFMILLAYIIIHLFTNYSSQSECNTTLYHWEQGAECVIDMGSMRMMWQ